MGLTNAQYDEIMRGYEQRQMFAEHQARKRLEEAYEKYPMIKKAQDMIASASLHMARLQLMGDKENIHKLRQQLERLKQKKASMIQAAGFSVDYFLPTYTCVDCKDTGYVGNKKCHCFQQEIIRLIYEQSNVQSILARENFSTFSYEYFSTTDKDPTTGRTVRENAELAVEKCKQFVRDFEDKPKNLFFYGTTGVGKTFLSNCVAKALLDEGKSVIYFTSFELFDILSKGIFEKQEDAIDAHRNIFACDLLIIDDLGTEFSNAFTVSQLFLCVNERILRGRSTIISTNLGINQMIDMYSERIMSRITSNYTMIKLFGDDIRIKKRAEAKGIHTQDL